jgi:hypothetical protein
MDSGSYEQFAEGHFLTAKMLAWFWDAYEPDVERRMEPFASPLRAGSTRCETRTRDTPRSRRPSRSYATP